MASLNPFDAAFAGKSVLITETRMEPLELIGRVGSTSFVIAGSRKPFCAESLNPYELMGAALGSCTAMTLRLHADLMGLPVSRIQVSVSHHSRHLRTMPLFERNIILEGPVSVEGRQRLMDVAERSPVYLTLRGGAEIRTFLSTERCVTHSAATSDYLQDIAQAGR